VLAFLATSYYDDVLPAKPSRPGGVELVAVDGDAVLGLIDVSVAADTATIETVATHPDHARRGLGRLLLERAVARLAPLGVRTLDAWTREDVAALAWYRGQGFVETSRYVHVHAGLSDVDDAVRPAPGLAAVGAFLHGRIEDEEQLRRRFARVHVCRRFVLDL
jgi:ribosomal protein S18 acetylase RimI-like enzyme